jgi:hypothetical protein
MIYMRSNNIGCLLRKLGKVGISAIILFVFLITLLSSLLFFPIVKGNTVNVTSRLQVQTFQTDFAFINWYLVTNTSNPQSSMVVVFSGDVANGSVPSLSPSLSVAEISKAFDPTTNLTTFSIEGAMPLGTVSPDFPNDRYEANYYIGSNFLNPNSDFYVGGDIPGPTDNYQIAWSLTNESNFMSRLDNLTRFMLTNNSPEIEKYTSWFRLNLQIFHRPPFSEYVGTLVNQVPLGLEVFGVFLAGVVLTPICYELVKKQPREIKKGHLVEIILIPICASVIVFVPVYELALHVFETPLLVMKVEQNMITLLTTYIVILGLGIAIRVITLLRERKPHYPWEARAKLLDTDKFEAQFDS